MTNTENHIIISAEKLNGLRDRAHEMAVEKGWHDKVRSDQHFLMLVITEVSEAVEAYREHGFDAWGECPDCGSRVVYDTPEGPSDDEHCGDWGAGFVCPLCGCSEPVEGPKPCGVGSELADVAIRLFDWVGLRGGSFEALDESLNALDMSQFPGDGGFVSGCFIMCESATEIRNFAPADVALAIIAIAHTLAEDASIDLWIGIENKMAFNATRSRRHGGKLA